MEELSELEARATLPGADPWGQPWEYTRGGREGGVDTPSLFNLIMEERMENIVEGWQARGQGFPLDDFRGVVANTISHAVWADNVWLISDTREGVLSMFREVTESIEEAGFEWKPSSLEMMAVNGNDRQGKYEVRSSRGKHSIKKVYTSPFSA